MLLPATIARPRTLTVYATLLQPGLKTGVPKVLIAALYHLAARKSVGYQLDDASFFLYFRRVYPVEIYPELSGSSEEGGKLVAGVCVAENPKVGAKLSQYAGLELDGASFIRVRLLF